MIMAIEKRWNWVENLWYCAHQNILIKHLTNKTFVYVRMIGNISVCQSIYSWIHSECFVVLIPNAHCKWKVNVSSCSAIVKLSLSLFVHGWIQRNCCAQLQLQKTLIRWMEKLNWQYFTNKITLKVNEILWFVWKIQYSNWKIHSHRLELEYTNLLLFVWISYRSALK